MKDLPYRDAIKFIEKSKLFSNYIELLVKRDETELIKEINGANDLKLKIFYHYLLEQKKVFALDFNDLLNYTYYIFNEREDILLKWQQRLQYVMVDEIQDVSIVQYALATLLSEYHKNLFIVGDPDQTIYSWRRNLDS